MDNRFKDKKIIFLGTPDFSVPALNALIASEYQIICVISQPNRPQGRKHISVDTPVAACAKEHQLKLIQPDSINEASVKEYLQSLHPDLLITAAYGQILKPDILAIPLYGCLNIHASLLPKYRGAAPIHAAVLDGQKETGITIMQMDQGCDTGDILYQNKIPISDQINTGELFVQLAELGAQTIVTFLPKFFSKDYRAIPQDPAQATFSPKLHRESGKIDWQQEATSIYNQIRGMQPWPGSYTFFAAQRLKIFSALLVDPLAVKGKPGELIDCRNGFVVQCKKGLLQLQEIQFSSGKRMFSQQCAHNYQTGQILGG